MDIATFNARRRFVEVDFGRVAYIDEGPAALFLHGVPLNGHHWRHVIGLVRERRCCIAVDRGAIAQVFAAHLPNA